MNAALRQPGKPRLPDIQDGRSGPWWGKQHRLLNGCRSVKRQFDFFVANTQDPWYANRNSSQWKPVNFQTYMGDRI
jgi:hypothetical protein